MKLFRYENTVFSAAYPHLSIQVVDRGDHRELRFGNHITQSASSLTAPDALALDYARAMVTGILFPTRLSRFLHIGLGAGSIPRYLHRHLPGIHQRVVEVYPEVVDVAYRYFDLPVSERLDVVTADGADFLRQEAERYQLIFLDAFHADGAIEHLNTATFYNLLLSHLEPGGWLVANQWGSDRENLYRRQRYLTACCDQLYSLSVRAGSNVIFFASRQPERPSLARMRRRARTLAQRMPLDLEGHLARVRVCLAPQERRRAMPSGD